MRGRATALAALLVSVLAAALLALGPYLPAAAGVAAADAGAPAHPAPSEPAAPAAEAAPGSQGVHPVYAVYPVHLVHLEARQFAYTPGVVRVPVGATVRLELAAHDVSHGLYLESYGVGLVAYPGRPASAEFTADRAGRFRFYCNTTCGQLHPFMLGELVVEPNWPLYGSLGLVPLAAALGLAWGWRPRGPRPGALTAGQLELTGWAPLRRVLASRTPQQGAIAGLLAVLTLAVLAGFGGSPVGSHNFAIIFVWIVWWGLLKLAFIPFGGRAWCAVCPLPAPGEWLQRGAVVSRRPASAPSGRPLSLGRAWPRRLRSGWLATGLLLGIGVASAPILTRPALTGWLLAGMAALALGLALVYRDRAFCRYVCPVGSFVGLYALATPLALRVRDRDVCLQHVEKECLRGSAGAYGCPWFAYPGTLARNLDCGLCLECLRACPRDNVALYLRAPGADFAAAAAPAGTGGKGSVAAARSWPRADEAYGAVVMLALAAIYSAVFLGPWGPLKAEALLATPADTVRHALLVGGGGGGLAPLLWLGVAALARWAAGRGAAPSRPAPGLRAVWAGTAYALVPLGLAAWAAFTVTFVLGSGTYVPATLADPLGWGWNLLGLATPWAPLAVELRLWLQVGTWLAGLAWSAAAGLALTRRLYGAGPAARRAGLVVAAGLAAATGGLAWLGLA